MTMTDPIADMLTRIRNAGRAGHKRVDIPLSGIKIEIARILTENYFVHGFKVLEDGRHGRLRLYLKYTSDERPVIRGIDRVSKPGLRKYLGTRAVPKVRAGMGIAIMSTSRGLMTDRDARRAGVGGEIIAKVY
ncbi:MAG: 30S ribosomal protein S8 [Gemmatimonadetes bacterium]|nr:30S ribosomal protein S8 [Gemmatimonadota bacterium]